MAEEQNELLDSGQQNVAESPSATNATPDNEVYTERDLSVSASPILLVSSKQIPGFQASSYGRLGVVGQCVAVRMNGDWHTILVDEAINIRLSEDPERLLSDGAKLYSIDEDVLLGGGFFAPNVDDDFAREHFGISIPATCERSIYFVTSIDRKS